METIISVVDSIIQRSIDYVQKLNSDSSKVDINHGNSENTQQHGATIGQGKSDESPEMIRNLITSIIQSSLYRVYEKDLLNKLRRTECFEHEEYHSDCNGFYSIFVNLQDGDNESKLTIYYLFIETF
ncbi:unnamed protein product [Schistosoma curassoni]|uniref:TCTP domain-containing protein n=1 Tax=Schistosoma curassoni TaxID=6186 RepID=A0A183L0V8_9TREM|nr:unnamed protein product [Schistosoma curassoni]